MIGDASRMNENCGLDLRMEPPFARAPVNDRWDGSILLFHVWKGRPSFLLFDATDIFELDFLNDFNLTGWLDAFEAKDKIWR